MNAVLGGIACLAASMAGFFLKRTYKRRFDFYNEFLSFVIFAENRIRLYKTTVLELVRDFSTPNEGFAAVLSQYAEELKAASGSESIMRLKYLTEKEHRELIDFFRVLGKNDYHGELSSLAKQIDELTRKTAELKQRLQKEGELAKKLGILIGIALFFIII